ncbi:hypothetical protein BGX31_005177, partial [Mortierella sp. GBA43]
MLYPSRSIVPTPKNALSLKQALEISNLYLEGAYKTQDNDIALTLCHDAEMSLSQAKAAYKKAWLGPNDNEYHVVRHGLATAYIDLGIRLERQGYRVQAQDICKKAEKWGGNANDRGRLALLYVHATDDQSTNNALIAASGADGLGTRHKQGVGVT